MKKLCVAILVVCLIFSLVSCKEADTCKHETIEATVLLEDLQKA